MTDTCRHGHPWTPANTYWRPDGHKRQCRTCHRERMRARSRAGRVGGTKPGTLDRRDYDPIAVDRAVAGDLNGAVLTVPERREAVRRLTDAGHPIRVIAERVKATPRTVVRIRARLRETR